MTKLLAILSFPALLAAQTSKPIVILGPNVSGGTGGPGAAITGLNVTATSPTQALIDLDYPGSSAFGIEVSDTPDYSTLIHDVNPALFAGANLSTRPGVIRAGNHYRIVVGRRTAETALDGARYSRALATVKTYYGRITAPGQTPLTFNFTTLNIPYDNAYLEPLRADPAKPGQTAWPSISKTDRASVIVDPMTGVEIHPIVLGSDERQYRSPSLNVSAPSPWSLANSTYTVSGSSVPIFASLNLDVAGGCFTNAAAFNGRLSFVPEWGAYGCGDRSNIGVLNVQITASATGTGEDAKLMRCVTADRVNCYNAPIEVPLSTTRAPYSLGAVANDSTLNVVDVWQPGDLGDVIPIYDQAPYYGNVNCNGTSVDHVGGSQFNYIWTSGSVINIAGTDYQIASTDNSEHLNLVAPGCTSAQSNAVYIARNFGILLWKKTSNGAISIASNIAANVRIDFATKQSDTGGKRHAHKIPVTDASGETGYMVEAGADVYWVSASTAKVRRLGSLGGTYNGTSHGFGFGINGSFDDTRAGTILTANRYGITSFTFSGDYSVENHDGGSLNICRGSGPPYVNSPCFVQYDYTTDPASLFASYTAGQPIPFDASHFANIGLNDINQGKMIIQVLYSPPGGDTTGLVVAWIFVFDPQATQNNEGAQAGCVGGGKTGCIIAGTPTWRGKDFRWCTYKGGISPYPGVFLPNGFATGRYEGGGPFYSQIVDGTADGSDTSFTNNIGSFRQCPANSWGAPTTAPPNGRCQQFTVGSEPQTPQHPAGTFGVALPGDYFQPGNSIIYGASTVNDFTGVEVAMVVDKRPGSAAGTQVITVERGVDLGGYGSPYDAAHLWNGIGVGGYINYSCRTQEDATNHYSGNYARWNWLTDPRGNKLDGDSWPYTPYTSGDHYSASSSGVFIGKGTTASFPVSADYYILHPPTNGQTYAQSLLAAPTAANITRPINNNPYIFNCASSAVCQSHPSVFDTPLATSDAYRFSAFDARPYLGGDSSGRSGGSDSAILIAGTAHTWKFAASSLPTLELPYQYSYPINAFAGHIPLASVSGPGSVLDDSPAGAYKYCIVHVDGQCHSGSHAGEAYANVPALVYPFCFQAAQNGALGSGQLDLCISGSPNNKDSIAQIDTLTGASRSLTNYTQSRHNSVFWNENFVSPDGKTLAYETNFAGGNPSAMVVALTVPPKPTPDGRNRLTFIPVAVPLAQRANSYGWIRFGYQENNGYGDANHRVTDSLSCTTEADHCAAFGTATTFPTLQPYWFEDQIMRGSATGADVSSAGITVQVPGRSGLAMYYQQVWKDKTSGAITTGPLSVALVP